MSDGAYSINPKLWGPMMWYLLHTLSYAYQPVLMNYYQTFFHIIFSIFPCPHCQYHYTQHLYKSPPNLQSAESLSKWVILLHNNVNQFKKKRVYSLEEAKELYYYKGELLFNHKYLTDLLTIIYESNIEINSIINILQILAHIIPCGTCSAKLVQYMKSPETINNIYRDNFEKVLEDFVEILDLHTVNMTENKYLLQKFHINPESLLTPPPPTPPTRNLHQDQQPLLASSTNKSRSGTLSDNDDDTPVVAVPPTVSKGIRRTIRNKIKDIKQFNKFHKKYLTLSEKSSV